MREQGQGNWLPKAHSLYLLLFHGKFWLRGRGPDTFYLPNKMRGMGDYGDEAVTPLRLALCLCNEEY